MIEIQPRLTFLKKVLLAKTYRYTDAHFGEPPSVVKERLSSSVGPNSLVCFLCFGNICRSPFAERYLEETTELEAISAGFFPEEGRKSPSHAVEAAKEFGIDLGGHKSVMVDDEMICRADIIFLMDFRNVADYNMRFSRKEKTALLGKIADTNGREIKDPYGKSVAEFQRTYQEIVDAIESIQMSFLS